MLGRLALVALLLLTAAGCWLDVPPTAWPPSALVPGEPVGLPNPLVVQVNDHELVWNQTVDAVDDYFKIEREERIRLVGGVITEGRIETFPTPAATCLEPWHGDSTPGYERLHATLQSLRRRASVRVMPVAGGYSIELVVVKEIEDLERPEESSIVSPEIRFESSVDRSRGGRQIGPLTLGWISLGRDVSLEQRILADLQARLSAPPPTPHPGHRLH